MADPRSRWHRHRELPRRRRPRGPDVGHEVPTSLLASFVTATLGAPAAALGLIEGIADGLAGAGRFVGGALSDDPHRRRTLAVGGYTATAVLSALIGVTTSPVQAGVLRGAA